MLGMDTLNRYLKANNLSQSVFADRVGVNQATISKLVRGTISPSISLALAIQRETGGAVPVDVWDEKAA